MRNVWIFAWKEFLLNLRSARFLVGLLLSLVIVPFTMQVSLDDYKTQRGIGEVETEYALKRMDSCIVWSSVRPVVVRQPEVLSLFSRGISHNVGCSTGIWLETVPVFPDRTRGSLSSPFMKVFSTLDFAGALGIMISLLALIFSYDAVTREREEGTLRFIFSSSTGRVAFLVGKWLGVILTVLPVVVFCFAMAVGFVSWGADIRFSASEWAGIGWMSLTSFVYLSLFAWMGIFISVLNNQSVNSVVLCMLSWLVFLFVIPSLTSYLSRNLSSLTAYERIENQKKDIRSVFWKDISHAYDSIRESLGMTGVRYLFNMEGADGEKDVRGGSRLVLEHSRRMAVRDFELRVEYADRCWQLDATYLRELSQQWRWQEGLNLLSPSATFSGVLSSLSYTDPTALQEYMDGVRAYRRDFLDFLTRREIVSSVAYVTPLPESDFMEEAKWKVYEDYYMGLTENDPAAFETVIREAEKKYTYRRYELVDTSELPRFVSRPLSGRERIGRGLPAFLFLCLVSLGFMGGAVYVFRKYDLR